MVCFFRNLLPLIKEYESMIETLTTQVEFYAVSEQERRFYKH